MNPTVISGIGAVLGLLVAMVTLAVHFDKRNGDRFDALQKQIEATKEVLRAEMQTMRAELLLAIYDGDRRISSK